MSIAMKTNTLSTESNEVRAYPQLQHEIHDALRVQHPEWIKPMVIVPPANLTSRDSQNCSVFLHPPNITGSFRSECSTSNFGTAFNLTKLHKPSERRTNVRGDRTFLGAAGFVTASALDIRHSTLLHSRIRAICGLLRPAAWRLKDFVKLHAHSKEGVSTNSSVASQNPTHAHSPEWNRQRVLEA
jgi:hypothetical protein